MAENLSSSLVSYRGQLLINPMMVSAVFLDPRFTRTMKLCAKTLAISKLTKVWIQYQNSSATSEQNVTENILNKKVDELDELLAAQERELSNGLETIELQSETEEQKIHRLLQKFANSRRENPKINVLDFWEQKKIEMPELYQLSQIIYTVSATQTSTERAFSTFAFIFSNYRTRINQKLLTDILIIRPNKDLFEKITCEHLENIKQR